MSLAQVVSSAVHHQNSAQQPPTEPGEPGSSEDGTPPAPSGNHIKPEQLDASDTTQTDSQAHGLSQRVSHYKSPPNTPAARTGPPRSLSFAYSFPHSSSRHNSDYHQYENTDLNPRSSYENTDFSFSQDSTDFRGVLESLPSREQTQGEKKGKRRDSRATDDGWLSHRIRWFAESPKDEHSNSAVPWATQEPENIQEGNEIGPKQDGVRQEGSEIGPRQEDGVRQEGSEIGPRQDGVRQDNGEDPSTHPSPVPGPADHGRRPVESHVREGLRRAFSLPHTHAENKAGKARWARLKSLFPNLPGHDQASPTVPGPSAVTSQAVNITDELITGGLSTLMLRLWFDRDEKAHRRVPILLHRLRIRVSDSYHPTEEKKMSFRIECEYANGAARWVIYRQLRDFVSLHTHYALSNVYNRLGDELPEFPLSSLGLPYLKFLKKEDAHITQASFARLQRETLENYLIKLIRAVMFHPSSNRLSGFLEVSALSIALARSGGAQYKGGYLQIHASNNGGGGFGRKGVSWKARKEYRWCAVRESYLVVLDEPGELTIWDVFLFDPDFRIERPKRYYRQGLNNILHNELAMVEHQFSSPDKPQSAENPMFQDLHLRAPFDKHDTDGRSLIGSIKSRVSKIFNLDSSHKRQQGHDMQSDTRRRQANIEATEDFESSSSVSLPPRVRTPMLDPSTTMNPLAVPDRKEDAGTDGQPTGQHGKKKAEGDVSKHTFYLVNSQMKLKLFARSERQMLQWITALERSASSSHYTGRNRFNSFAPIRLNVAAQWLVDGRDYFWNLSRAILLAREVIFIHDWWLSPELLLRRPSKERYRLDHLLERKAKEGVKIYVILYQEVSNRTTPTDSNYAKQRLMGLHPNIMVQRSPSHFQTGTFYWAHHEKVCVIDHAIAFMGGIDLCFGRWDTAQHVLVDDVDGTDRPEIWPGKDYSNPRISDFHTLNKPEEDMYDRTKSPRMPWHDVAMQVVGQPARDLARHFVQRWNYLLRIKKHTRVMPFLLPPPEFRPGELTQMGLTGTCEMQICRSAGPWSMGTPTKIEHSIQNAYLKAIQMSEHFVYIENQFFITSTVVNDVKVENNIGDAIVHRIIKAHRDGTPWKCCIVIPLLPGFTFPVDHSDASAIRIILECQNRTISRGPDSIFSRLKKEGIDPNEYITLFSLRNWARMRGDVLTTEQVYIHGKVCIVDDRLVIIGSANINERSQRGDRDSELAAVIRDTDMINGSMAGQTFKVGRFAHTLRVRLMREHLGVDVDALDEEDLMVNEPVQPEHEQQPWDPEGLQEYGMSEGITRIKKHDALGTLAKAGLATTKQAGFAVSEGTSAEMARELHKAEILKHDTVTRGVEDPTLEPEPQTNTKEEREEKGYASSTVPTVEEKTIAEGRPSPPEVEHTLDHPQKHTTPEGAQQMRRHSGEAQTSVGTNGQGPPAHAPSSDNDGSHLRLREKDEEQEESSARSVIRKQQVSKLGTKWAVPVARPHVDPDAFEDPISDAFWRNTWVASATYNTEIYRKVFHAIPDDTVTTWKQYKEFVAHHERLKKPVPETGEPIAQVPSDLGDNSYLFHENATPREVVDGSSEGSKGCNETNHPEPTHPPNDNDEPARKPAKGSEPFEKWERDEMEELLKELNGHLVIYPTQFLEGEDIANNFLFNADRLLPLPIYD